jgi:putative transposase
VEKFRNKYKIESTRLQRWDYGWNGAYYITICTQKKVCFFGKISNCINELSDIGNIAEKCWSEIPLHFSFVELAEFVIMPNHMHGIIVINKRRDVINGECRDAINRVSTNPIVPMAPGGFAGNKNPMLNENISRIVRWYKGRVSFECRNLHSGFSWQPRFYDHIIRDNEEFLRIISYINDNPLKWEQDNFYI